MYQQAVNHILRCRFVKYELGLRKIREEPLRRALFIREREDSLSNNSCTMRRYTFESASILYCYQRNRVEGKLNASGRETNDTNGTLATLYLYEHVWYTILSRFLLHPYRSYFHFELVARTCQFSSSDSFVV